MSTAEHDWPRLTAVEVDDRWLTATYLSGLGTGTVPVETMGAKAR